MINVYMQLRDLEMEKRDPKTVVAVILGGGAGTRLFPLTKRRAKPAVSLSFHYIFQGVLLAVKPLIKVSFCGTCIYIYIYIFISF